MIYKKLERLEELQGCNKILINGVKTIIKKFLVDDFTDVTDWDTIIETDHGSYSRGFLLSRGEYKKNNIHVVDKEKYPEYYL